MTSLRPAWLTDRRGIASVEFALIVPVLLLLLGGVADFGLLMMGRSQLANGVAQAVQYALLTGPSVSATTVSSVVKAGSARAGISATVSVQVIGPACYCVSGQPAALFGSSTAVSATYACTSICPNTRSPGAFLIITASYTYQPLMPLYSHLSNTVVAQMVTVQLQ
jgi:Flp pilus assembly protein TadG